MINNSNKNSLESILRKGLSKLSFLPPLPEHPFLKDLPIAVVELPAAKNLELLIGILYAIGSFIPSNIDKDRKIPEQFKRLRLSYIECFRNNKDYFANKIMQIESLNFELHESLIINSALCEIYENDINYLYRFLAEIVDMGIKIDDNKLTELAKSIAHEKLESNPEFFILNDLLSVIYYNEKDYERSLSYMNKSKAHLLSIKNSSNDQEIKYALESLNSSILGAEALQKLETAKILTDTDPNRAISVLKNIQIPLGDWWEQKYYLGLAYMKTNQNQLAINSFKSTLELFSGCYKAYEHMADIYLKDSSLYNINLAIDNFHKCLEIEPVNASVLSKLSYAIFLSGNQDRAIKILNEARLIDSDDVDVSMYSKIINNS